MDLETAFWNTSDVVLISLIINTLIKYIKLKRRDSEAKHNLAIELSFAKVKRYWRLLKN